MLDVIVLLIQAALGAILKGMINLYAAFWSAVEARKTPAWVIVIGVLGCYGAIAALIFLF